MNAVKTKEKNDFIEILYRNITTSLPQYVFWKDLNSVYLGCNKNYSNLLGLSSTDAIIGKTDADLNWQHFGHSADNFKQDDEATIAGNPITNKEEILSLPNGKTLITLVSKLPISENNKVFGIVGYFTDITELRNKEEK